MSNRINTIRIVPDNQFEIISRKCIKCLEIKPIVDFGVTNSYISKDGTKKNWRKYTCRKCLKG